MTTVFVQVSIHYTSIRLYCINSRTTGFFRYYIDGTAELVSRDQILRRERGQGNTHFPCSADYEQDWIGNSTRLIFTLAVCDEHTYIVNPVLFNGEPDYSRCHVELLL